MAAAYGGGAAAVAAEALYESPVRRVCPVPGIRRVRGDREVRRVRPAVLLFLLLA